MSATMRLRRVTARAGSLWTQLRHPVEDVATPEGRARERRRRAMLASLMSMAAKAVSVATALITVPITLRYLGGERYGMWIVLSSMVAMLSFTDLGIGNGVLNAVAAAHGRDDRQGIREAVSSGAAALCGIALVAVVALAIAYPHVGWSAFFNVRSPLARAEAGPAVAAFVLCFAVAIPTNIVQRTQLGLQEGFVASAWLCAGSLFTLPAVLLAVHLEAGLPVLVAVLMGAPLIAALLNTVYFFGFRRPDLRPSPAHVRLAEIGAATRAGGMFLFIQLGNSVMIGSVPIVIAHTAGPTAMAQYAVPERLMAIVVMLVSMYVQPLWPAFREALTRGDGRWVIDAYRQTLVRVALAATAVLLVMATAMPWILYLWVGPLVRVPALLVFGLCLSKLMEAILWVNAMLLNGLHVIAPQAILSVGSAAVFVLCTYIAGMLGGVVAIPWTAGLVILCTSVLPGGLLVRHHLRRLA